MFLTDMATTYRQDRPLFEKLGLATFSTDNHNKIELGTVTLLYEDGQVSGKVDIAVTCLPAQFWHFKILSVEDNNQVTAVDTGSGCLSDYWPMVEKIAEGMFCVKSVQKQLEVKSNEAEREAMRVKAIAEMHNITRTLTSAKIPFTVTVSDSSIDITARSDGKLLHDFMRAVKSNSLSYDGRIANISLWW